MVPFPDAAQPNSGSNGVGEGKDESCPGYGAEDASHPWNGLVLFIDNDIMGSDVELGRILMRNYIHTIVEGDRLPRCMILLNRGVYLTTAGSAVLEDLLSLQEMGVQILSCGTCLDYFRLKDDLKVGQVTNMYAIADILARADRVISL